MSLNTARQGHVYTGYVYEVGREKVRQYALAIGVDDPALNEDPPGTPTRCPPSFVTVATARSLTMVIDDPELGATWNLLHTAQTFELRRAVRVGDVLSCTPRLTRVVPRGRMDLLEMVVDVADHGDGTPVAAVTSALVIFNSDVED